MSHQAHFPETTTRTGESLLDSVNCSGLALLLCGIIILGSSLTAATDGFDGWTITWSLISALCLLAGAAVILIEHQHARTDGSVHTMQK
ncbi:MAG: hypothetical protein JWN03_6424 [Nocardia sp.]|uniref:hypothetical protein n=1 Tax=Nocardia sp. TaxID=1821 RepID=UPI002617DEF8|nr:hypothetical protein [Nocardia sp.]MCU1646149.1 hypothetical protein [Nocardia sp.]